MIRTITSTGRRGWAILLLLVVLVLLSGLYSVHLGVSQMWDIRNYHLYNPFAFLHERYLTDVAPAQLQTFYNPTLDLPFYQLIKLLNDWPRLIAFLIGALHGFSLLCVALLAWQLLGGIDRMSVGLRLFLSAIALLIGATGAGSTPLIGSWTGDPQTTLPVLVALLFVVHGINRAQTDPTSTLKSLVIAGLFAGLATGLKLTMVIYAVALAASLLVLPRALLVRAALCFSGGGIIGVLASGGRHYFVMWRLFGNPLFPYYNNIFRSPFAAPEDFADKRYLPKNWVDWLFYPFEWAYDGHPGLVSQLAFRDIRIATAILLGALAAVTWLVSRLMSQPQRSPITPGVRALIIFMIVGYLLWLAIFSQYRYLLTIEMLSGVAIVLALGRLVQREAWPVLAVLAAAVCIVTTIPQEWGHSSFKKRYLEVTAPTFQPDTLVVIVGDNPVAYFIPFVDPNVRWVNVLSNFLRPEQENLLMRRARDLIQAHRGPLLVLRAGATDADLAKVLASFSLVPGSGDCAPLYSNLAKGRYELCPVERSVP